MRSSKSVGLLVLAWATAAVFFLAAPDLAYRNGNPSKRMTFSPGRCIHLKDADHTSREAMFSSCRSLSSSDDFFVVMGGMMELHEIVPAMARLGEVLPLFFPRFGSLELRNKVSDLGYGYMFDNRCSEHFLAATCAFVFTKCSHSECMPTHSWSACTVSQHIRSWIDCAAVDEGCGDDVACADKLQETMVRQMHAVITGVEEYIGYGLITDNEGETIALGLGFRKISRAWHRFCRSGSQDPHSTIPRRAMLLESGEKTLQVINGSSTAPTDREGRRIARPEQRSYRNRDEKQTDSSHTDCCCCAVEHICTARKPADPHSGSRTPRIETRGYSACVFIFAAVLVFLAGHNYKWACMIDAGGRD